MKELLIESQFWRKPNSLGKLPPNICAANREKMNMKMHISTTFIIKKTNVKEIDHAGLQHFDNDLHEGQGAQQFCDSEHSQ